MTEIGKSFFYDLIQTASCQYQYVINNFANNDASTVAMLNDVREPTWSCIRQNCSSFSRMDSEGQFSQTFELKVFQLKRNEKELFVSKLDLQGFCNACHKFIDTQIELFLHFLRMSDIINYNSGTQSWSTALTSNLVNQNLHCQQCDNCIDTVASDIKFSPSKILFVQFASDVINLLSFLQNINILGTDYSLRAIVRCINHHFSCAVYQNNSWSFIDDLCDRVQYFTSIQQLYHLHQEGCF